MTPDEAATVIARYFIAMAWDDNSDMPEDLPKFNGDVRDMISARIDVLAALPPAADIQTAIATLTPETR
jgi:hypothetical protein